MALACVLYGLVAVSQTLMILHLLDQVGKINRYIGRWRGD